MKPRAIIRPVSGDDWCPPGETNFSFISEIVLRKPLLVAQAARMLKGVAIMLAFRVRPPSSMPSSAAITSFSVIC